MKKFLWAILSLAVMLFLSRADAGSVNNVRRWTSIDKIQESINNPSAPASMVDLPTVNVKGTEIKGYAVPMRGAAATRTFNQRELNTVEQKSVDIKRRDVSTLDMSVRSKPQTNFAAKRSSISTQPYPDAAKLSTVGAAPVTKRRIIISTPEGLEDLKNQLNRVP